MKTNADSTFQVCLKLRTFVLALIAIAIIAPSKIRATAYYWDLNQGTAGVGGATPSGNWDGTTLNWNASSTGGSGTYVATPGTGNDGTFTANSESTGNYTITLTGTQYAKSLTAKYGNATLHGGTLALDNNTSSGTAYLVASSGANLTLDNTCTLSVNNGTAGNNYVNLGAAASQTVTINGPVTATVNNSANKIFIRSTTAGNNIINYDLGTDAAFKTGLQAGGFDGVGTGGTLTLKGPQSLGTTPYNNSARLGTFNLGDTVNTGNAVSLGTVTLAGTANNLAGATINFNSAVTCSSIILSSGGALNVGGSVTTSGTTAVGRTSDTFHGATMKILSGGSASLGTVNVLDGSTLTTAGALSGGTLTLGEATGNTTGSLVLGDATAAGTATFTGLTASGSGAKSIVGGNASASTLTLNLGSTTTLGASLTFGGASANQNNLTLDKTGSGTLVMQNGANTYSGGTIFENGGIQLGANNALGSGPLTIGTANTSLSVNSGFLKFQLSGYDQTVTGLANGNVGTIIIEANASPAGGNNILTVNQAASTTSTYSGTLRNISTGGSGVLSLTKSGNGTLSLSAANGYTGNTTVTAGTLQLTAGSLANTAITVSSGTFSVQPSSSTTIAAGSTSTAGAGASLNLGGNIFDMTDGAISQFNLYQGSGFGTALTIGNGATLKFNLGNSSADKMVVSSAASASGTINVTLDTSLMTAPITGNYSLITAASGLDGGIWQFSDTGNQTKTVTVNGSAYTLTLNHGVTSVYVTVAAKTASQLVFTTQPSASTVAGVAFAQQPVVKIEDQYGNVVTSGADATVNVALALTTGTGTLAGTTSMNAVAGVADFTGKGLNINLVGADKVLTATATVTAGTKTATTSPAFVITPAALDHFNISNIISPQTNRSQFIIAAVTAQDTYGNTATNFVGTVSFGGTAGISGTSSAFTLGVLNNVSVTPSVAGANLTVTVDDGSTHTGVTTIDLIDKSGTSVGASSTNNPCGYHDAVAFIATLPTDATGSVVFSSTNGPISTNTLSSGTTTSLSTTNLPRGTNVITVAYLGDGNYLGSSTNIDQIVTNHPPVLAPLNLTRTAGLGLHFSWSQLTNQWSDVDGDAVALTTFNLSTSNSVTLFTNDTLVGYPSSAPNEADQINYTASDSYGDIVTGVINIAINAYVAGTNSIVSITAGNPTTLKAYGVIGFSYITERSTNLTDWVSVATNTVSTNGVISVSDSFSDLGGQQPNPAFYRIKWQP